MISPDIHFQGFQSDQRTEAVGMIQTITGISGNHRESLWEKSILDSRKRNGPDRNFKKNVSSVEQYGQQSRRSDTLMLSEIEKSL